VDAEVIVVGAGPAGSSAAYHLARRARKVVLLEGARFPRNKSCGDALIPRAVHMLEEMNILQQLRNPQRIRGVRVFMRENGSRDFEYSRGERPTQYGMVVPRLLLDQVVCHAATTAGAELLEETTATKLVFAQGAVTGVDVVRNGRENRLRSYVVVAADGALSGLARQAGITPPKNAFGFAVRGYYEQVEDPGEMLEIYLPLTDVTNQYVLPSYGWVFPTGPATANVGVGLFHRALSANVRQVFTRFTEMLCREDLRFVKAELSGGLKGAPLRFDFTAERCVRAGFLLVGDAAGLVNPFTGEGISYALESGKLAAGVIDRNLRRGILGAPNLSEYATILRDRYATHFQNGSESHSRSELMWRLLEATFQNDRTFFARCRSRLPS
jgi:geranylgeranyl reductase family protein